MKKTIKQIALIMKQSNKALLFQETLLYPYPEIPDDDNNFITDYNTYSEAYDRYFIKEYGDRYVEYDAETDADFIEDWEDDLYATVLIYLDAWARLYYAMHINYNPVYNVEEHTKTTYGEHSTDTAYGERTHTKGQQENTNGTHTDTSTQYNVATDSTQEKESGKQTDEYGQQVNTEGQRIDTEGEVIDTVTSNQHIDTVDRSGNIGVVSATDLLNAEIEQKKRLSFFKNVFIVLVEEVGAYYESILL